MGAAISDYPQINELCQKISDEGLTMSVASFRADSVTDELVKTLNTMCNVGNYKVAVLFVTDIINNGSYIFFNDSAKDIVEEAYRVENISEGAYLNNVVSRKKQMLPPLLENVN